MKDENRRAMYAKKNGGSGVSSKSAESVRIINGKKYDKFGKQIFTLKEKIINFMNGYGKTPTVPQLVKFINDKSDFTAKVVDESWNHKGRTHPSGVRYTSGHKEYAWKITVKDKDGNVVYDDVPYRTQDFTVWVFEEIMNRRHWRLSQRSSDDPRRISKNITTDEFEKIRKEDERDDPTGD